MITLVIIGVVAALTIPTLISKHQDYVTLTKLKKAYSNLSRAAQLVVAEGNSPFYDDWYEDGSLSDDKFILNKIKHIKGCDSWCQNLNPAYGPFSNSKYIVSDDGIIYGYHGTIPADGINEPFEEVGTLAVDLSNYEDITNDSPELKRNGKNITYGFYLKEDGTVVPAGTPGYNPNNNLSINSTCPNYNNGYPNEYCTYWTLRTGKVKKKAGEWFE